MVRIEFSKLHTQIDTASGEFVKVPPKEMNLDDPGHIHGEMIIDIEGKSVPNMGFFGPDDVCFNEWIEQLQSIREWIPQQESDGYSFADQEQGQPIFLFRRRSDTIVVSVLDRDSGNPICADFNDVECSGSELAHAIDSFLVAFSVDALKNWPIAYDRWCAAYGIKI